MRRALKGSVSQIILQGAGISMAIRIAGVVLSYGANILISRMLGVQAFGEYVIAALACYALMRVGANGATELAVPFVSGFVFDFGWAQLKGWFAWCLGALIHVYLLVGFQHRLMVAMQWLWRYVTYERGSRLIAEDASKEA